MTHAEKEIVDAHRRQHEHGKKEFKDACWALDREDLRTRLRIVKEALASGDPKVRANAMLEYDAYFRERDKRRRDYEKANQGFLRDKLPEYGAKDKQ